MDDKDNSSMKDPDYLSKVMELYFNSDMGEDETDGSSYEDRREKLRESEKRILASIQPEGQIRDIDVGKGRTVHTLCFNPPHPPSGDLAKVPLVMLHGIGIGLPTFWKNYGTLAHDRTVYGIDMPGFALTSELAPSKCSIKCEEEMVNYIEDWRIAMHLEKIIILGHSFGGYIAATYALTHKDRVCHLVLAEPWGILSKEDDPNKQHEKMFSEKCSSYLCKSLKINPLQVAHRFGSKFCSLLEERFLSKENKYYGDTCIHYAIMSVTNGSQSGSKAWAILSNYKFFYPKDPMKQRLTNLQDPKLSITFIYGEKSKYNNRGGIEIMEKLGQDRVRVEIIKDAQHHAHVEKSEEFNDIVKSILGAVDLVRRQGVAL